MCVCVCACVAQCKEINDATRRRRGDDDDATNTTRTQVQPQTLIINGNPSLRIREKEENSHTSSTSPKQERGPPLAVAFQMNCLWGPAQSCVGLRRKILILYFMLAILLKQKFPPCELLRLRKSCAGVYNPAMMPKKTKLRTKKISMDA